MLDSYRHGYGGSLPRTPYRLRTVTPSPGSSDCRLPTVADQGFHIPATNNRSCVVRVMGIWLAKSWLTVQSKDPGRRRACFRLLGEPKTVSLANSLPARPTLNLRPSPCVRHIAYPISPGRPNAHPGRTPSPKPDPLAPPYPKKTSLSRATRSPTLTHPTPHTTHLVPTPASFLPTNPPRSRNFATPLEIYAQACYPRSREEPAPRPGNPTLKRGKAPGIRRGALWQSCGCPMAVLWASVGASSLVGALWQ